MYFQKVIYENVEKNFLFHNKHLHIRVTDILKFYEVVFCTYCKGLFCLWKAVIMLKTLGNEKEQLQIKFYEKLFCELIFLWTTKVIPLT